MKFSRPSKPEDRCWFCRRRCGELVLGTSPAFVGHSRYAVWMRHLQRHIEVSAHEACFMDSDE